MLSRVRAFLTTVLATFSRCLSAFRSFDDALAGVWAARIVLMAVFAERWAYQTSSVLIWANPAIASR